MQSGPVSIIWKAPYPVEGVLAYFSLPPCFIEIPVVNANSVDPDQMPYSAASDLGLHCFPMSVLWDVTR